MNRYLLFVSKAYSFAILRPLAQAITAQGDEPYWFVHGLAADSHLHEHDRRVRSVDEVRSLAPRAVFAPGNWVPDFFPGAKVEIFHGFGIEKKGHFRIRGLFDLYCTHGPLTTERFKRLRERHQHFWVSETGWPKMDPLFKRTPAAAALRAEDERPIVLYAPTFSPSLTSAPALRTEIQRLSALQNYRWLIKFHPKMDAASVRAFTDMSEGNLQVMGEGDTLSLLQAADVMLSDTSSVVTEFLLLDKPVVTYRTAEPRDHVLNVEAPEQLAAALDHALAHPPGLMRAARSYVREMHPYNDGLSSQRVLRATDAFIEEHQHALAAKPLNLKRRLDIRRRMRYYHWR